MNRLIDFINGFLSRSGNYVLFSTVVSRVLSFFSSWLALQLIDNSELGIILFAFSIIQFMIPIGGFGLHQSLIRYGALLNSSEEKEKLFSYVFKKGIFASVWIILFVILISYWIPFQFEKTFVYLAILSLSILSFFIFEIVKVQFRLQHRNKMYAILELVYNLILVILVFALSHLYQGYGYTVALVISPLIAALIFFKKLRISILTKSELSIAKMEFWKYGFFGGLSSVVTQFLVLVDLILVGYIMEDPIHVTNYRYVSIIPLSLLFLPRVFITTDFVSFTEKIFDSRFIYNYIKNYLLFFTVVSLILISIGYFLGGDILSVFGQEFIEYKQTFFVLMLGIGGIYIFRGLFGNLLSSLGKIEYNYYIISIAILLNFISNYYLIPKFGIHGAAITSAILMWFTGILSCIAFVYFYRKLSHEQTD